MSNAALVTPYVDLEPRTVTLTTPEDGANAAPAASTTSSDDPYHPTNLIVGAGECVNLPNHSFYDVLMRLPLPGIVIFVHGVNSDGEWYRQAEEGLCKGLNARLRRCDEHLVHCGPAAGQLFPANYLPELTPKGFINPEMDASSFIQSDDTFSPVIHFRWGYKASAEELQKYGSGIYLNEQDYWGGGPFANGCSTLPDLWGQGLSEELFLFLHVQHLNPTNDRNVYNSPPRPYFVLHAYRLAKLVESIRLKQADVPITIVCHSQGNMVGMAAAFLGDAMQHGTDGFQGAASQVRCVADTYVLCNAPYSLVKNNATESWTERGMEDGEGRTGRQTVESRKGTLAAFFQIIRQQAAFQQAAFQQAAERIDDRMANEAHGFTAQADRDAHGLAGKTAGRVTLYCNPHDQVISAATVQGIGWRGLSVAEIRDTGGEGVFTQRVFAQGWPVGDATKTQYNYWTDQYNLAKEGKDVLGSQKFWQPESPPARYSIRKGYDADGFFGRVFTVLAAPVMYLVTWALDTRVNALPPVKDEETGRPGLWTIPLAAPTLPAPFLPQAVGLAGASVEFDQGFDAPGAYRNRSVQRAADDPYANTTRSVRDGGTDAPQGDASSEAGLQYENHAYLRMEAKREGKVAADKKVEQETPSGQATPDYTAWRNHKIKTYLTENIDTHATDHSTIMTNPMHAEKALAYDVAIGNCDIYEEDLHKLRMAADWRFLSGLEKGDPHKVFFKYFEKGQFQGKSVYDWANAKGSEGQIPSKIKNRRQWGPKPKVGEQ